MKKFFVTAAIIVAAMSAKAAVVSRDTVAYTGEYRLEKIEKANEYGEVSVRYVAYLYAVVNKKGEPRKVTIDRKTYESGKVDAIVYTTSDTGSKRIAKAVNTGK